MPAGFLCTTTLLEHALGMMVPFVLFDNIKDDPEPQEEGDEEPYKADDRDAEDNRLNARIVDNRGADEEACRDDTHS